MAKDTSPLCECGDTESLHYTNNDPEGPCMVADCGCRAFTPREEKD